MGSLLTKAAESADALISVFRRLTNNFANALFGLITTINGLATVHLVAGAMDSTDLPRFNRVFRAITTLMPEIQLFAQTLSTQLGIISRRISNTTEYDSLAACLKGFDSDMVVAAAARLATAIGVLLPTVVEFLNYVENKYHASTLQTERKNSAIISIIACAVCVVCLGGILGGAGFAACLAGYGWVFGCCAVVSGSYAYCKLEPSESERAKKFLDNVKGSCSELSSGLIDVQAKLCPSTLGMVGSFTGQGGKQNRKECTKLTTDVISVCDRMVKVCRMI
jgi:hypothetical protein